MEGTDLPDLDNLVEIAMFEHDMIENDFYVRAHQLITSRKTVVEQDDVLLGRTDMQGICWRNGDSSKDSYRQYRERTQPVMAVYYPYDPPLEENRDELDYTGQEYYGFRYTDTSYHCNYGHPQLRNLVCAPSKNDVYYLHYDTVQHWCPQLRTSRTILGRPLKGAHGRLPNRVTTMAAMDDLLLVGGDDGSFTFMNLRTRGSPIFGSFTDGDHMEINGIEVSQSRTGGWFANYTSQSPDGHMIGIVGDDRDALVMSVNSRETIATLKGHKRFSFSVAWSPDSRMIATGSDDKSTCIYDARMLADPVHILSRDVMDSVRSLRYSPCGRYLVMAEDRNYIHIVDTKSDYSKAQKIDFVGDVSGISLTPDGESLFAGVSSVNFS
ncbi:hypothetical protein BGX31_007098 [Mortierella sp. GBA43]|nr:hypothetical protein BGX31_007098 [Mortierella sp. GBA43]